MLPAGSLYQPRFGPHFRGPAKNRRDERLPPCRARSRSLREAPGPHTPNRAVFGYCSVTAEVNGSWHGDEPPLLLPKYAEVRVAETTRAKRVISMHLFSLLSIFGPRLRSVRRSPRAAYRGTGANREATQGTHTKDGARCNVRRTPGVHSTRSGLRVTARGLVSPPRGYLSLAPRKGTT